MICAATMLAVWPTTTWVTTWIAIRKCWRIYGGREVRREDSGWRDARTVGGETRLRFTLILTSVFCSWYKFLDFDLNAVPFFALLSCFCVHLWFAVAGRVVWSTRCRIALKEALICCGVFALAAWRWLTSCFVPALIYFRVIL